MNDSTRTALDERNRFLVALDDATRPLEQPEQVTQTAARLLGTHLGVNRCAYADVEADENTFNLTGDYNSGVASIVGRYTFEQFGSECLRLMRAGAPYVVEDSETDARTAEVRESYRLTQIRAVICVSLLKSGRFVAAMAVHQLTPRRWTADDVELVQLVASRCWESIERSRVGRELRESEFRFRGVVQATPECVKIVAPDGKVLFMNRAGLDMVECESEAALAGRRVFDLIASEHRNRWQEQHARVCRGERLSWEFEIVGLAGTRRWMETHAVPLPLPDGRTGQLAVTREITQRKRAEAERETLLESERIARANAERASALKDEFLATLSHELRTPLNAIVGWTHVLRNGADPTLVREGLEVIARNARAQAQIVEDLLDMNRIMAGRLRLDVRPTDLAVVLEQALDSLRPAADAKGVRLQAILDPHAGPVSGDPNRLQQVFWNLFSNSIKFTPRGGRVQVTLERVNSHLEVSVADTGEGISPEFLPHVFDRFRQADASTTRRHGGLGLGLSISRELVQLHGGSIRAQSAGVNAGATFTVALPLAAVTAHPERETRSHPRAASSATALADGITLNGVRVLMVDDEADARNLIRRVLEEHGAEVATAGSADQAVARLKGERFDVLVSDVGMPGEDGYALIRRVRALARDEGGAVAALALTAYARAEDRVRAVLAGFQMHIAKPVEPVELIAVVASLAGRTRNGPRPS